MSITQRRSVVRRYLGAALLLLLILLPAACSKVPESQPGSAPEQPPGVTPAADSAPGIAETNAVAVATVVARSAEDVSMALPEAFRFEVTRRPAGAQRSAETTVTGQYRDGAWFQSVRSGDQFAEELVVDGGDRPRSYTRPLGEEVWTRWPGVGFDAGYGLASPFAALRLYPLVDRSSPRQLAQVAGAPVATFRTQTVFLATTIEALLTASVLDLTIDSATRAALAEQMAPLAVQQTVTYWIGEDSHVYRAAATLLAADETGAPKPWLEVTWKFWAYDDPRIAVDIPTAVNDAPAPPGVGTASPESPQRAAVAPEVAPDTLLIRVYSSPDVPAEMVAVSVFPAGDARQYIDWRDSAEAHFALPTGVYDVLVQMDYAQEWIRDVVVAEGELAEHSVVFDFGILELAITLDGATVPVEVVTYPAGDRTNWVDWRSDNPASIQLREGYYDVEIAYADYTAKQTLTDLEVVAGETNHLDIDLGD